MAAASTFFPHHENEIAQSEAATGKPFAKYWLHNGLTRKATKLPGGQIRWDKESKSLGNVTDARELIATGGADFVRYLLLRLALSFPHRHQRRSDGGEK